MSAPPKSPDTLSIRPRLIGLVTAALLVVTGCAGQPGSGATGTAAGTATNAAAASAAFSFTDDRAETVKLDKKEIRVVAQEDAANALMHLGIRPVGIFGGAPLNGNPMLKGLDLTGIESVGEVFGEVKMEKLASLRPDVIVSTFYTGDGVLFPGGVYGFQTAKMQNDAKTIAPILAIDSTKPSSHVIERFSALAKALGADVDGGAVAQARTKWAGAVEALKSTAKQHPDLKVLAVTPAQEQVYFAVPDLFPDLLDLRDWGIDLMTPDGKLVSSYYEAVSWENAAKYQPSVVLVDARGYTLGIDALKKYPTWNALKAVKAGQVGSWVRVSLNYNDYTRQVQDLTAVLERAKNV
ncbi:ABC transporter substrate-binding protein [Nonomuraea sp. NPDC049141]|uniref:ABC transporter substrate-binding protein n=1 Tax=Nonomuraea sp. NPDC049141 TaxID=3155500 RepID=UPI0033C3485D